MLPATGGHHANCEVVKDHRAQDLGVNETNRKATPGGTTTLAKLGVMTIEEILDNLQRRLELQHR